MTVEKGEFATSGRCAMNAPTVSRGRLVIQGWIRCYSRRSAPVERRGKRRRAARRGGYEADGRQVKGSPHKDGNAQGLLAQSSVVSTLSYVTCDGSITSMDPTSF